MKSFLPYVILVLLLCRCASKNCGKQNSFIQGEWIAKGVLKQGTVTFTQDSVYYSFYEKSFSYLIDKDSIRIFFPDKIAIAKHSIGKDTMILFFEDGVDTLLKKH